MARSWVTDPMAKQLNSMGPLCEALGIERVNEVVRVVLDIDTKRGYPVLYVERIGDMQQIVAALAAPGIEIKHVERAPS